MSYYETLEVSPNASQAVIKAAYKSLMQRYHPDKNPDDSSVAERAVQVLRAYEVLSNEAKRAAYDEQLKQRLQAQTISARDLSGVMGRQRVFSNRDDVQERKYY